MDMKVDELEILASELKLDNILVKPEDVILTMEGKGDLVDTFPIPNCEECADKCCPRAVAISLFDVARFIDVGMDDYIGGRFEGYVELFLSENGGKDVSISRCYMSPSDVDAKNCVFLNKEMRCNIYENRPLICRSFPIAVRIDEHKNRVGIWMDGCRNFDIKPDKDAFQWLLENAVQDYNEKLKSNALLMHSRQKLRDIGFGRFMEDEMNNLVHYSKKSRELEKQVTDLEKVVERLRIPQDQNAIIERLSNENEWLKERIVSLEKEIEQQRERSHSIISDFTKQFTTEHKKMLESIIQSKTEERNKKSFWRR